jgi:ParB-like chromosome segregation protein Spo0J
VSASGALSGAQFMHVGELHPVYTDHPRSRAGDDEDYNNYEANPGVAYDRLKQDIARHGVTQPLLVQRGTNGKTAVLDGHHRLQAAKELGITHLPVRQLK